jgi:hypothetical protein
LWKNRKNENKKNPIKYLEEKPQKSFENQTKNKTIEEPMKTSKNSSETSQNRLKRPN